jgi:uncharacterized protein (UPF0212 family)
MNYKWQAFLAALQIVAVANTNPQKAAAIVSLAIENTDAIGWSVRGYAKPASDMALDFVNFQLGRTPAPEWWAHSATQPEG